MARCPLRLLPHALSPPLACALALVAAPARAATLPIAISADRTHLVDATGAPFFLQGDSAWEAIPALTQPELATYLADRKSRGFNAIIMQLAGHVATTHEPHWLDAAGEAPFNWTLGGKSCAKPGGDLCDVSTPNSAYFAHVDRVLQQAQSSGMVVLLFPLYLGYLCQEEGWCVEMRANGTAKVAALGRFLGARYRSYPNIVWVEGGDAKPSTTGSPSDLDLVNALANGIVEGEGGGKGTHLQTAHWGRETSAADLPGITFPLSVDATYSYLGKNLYKKAVADTERDSRTRPAFLIESLYENEHATPTTVLRAQMYEPILSGETGFVLGSNPLWMFARTGDGNPGWNVATSPIAIPTWQAALGSPGSLDAQRAGQFFRSVAWWNLAPDGSRRVMTSLSTSSAGLLASTADHTLAIAYFTDAATATIDLSGMAGATTVSWFDPSLGTTTPIGTFANRGSRSFTTPATNAVGAEDWVLLLQATAATAPVPAPRRKTAWIAPLVLAAGLMGAMRRARSDRAPSSPPS
jgi:Protein of unknown function (DUF4038)/Putative collagen-binding domain of a collagenase